LHERVSVCVCERVHVCVREYVIIMHERICVCVYVLCVVFVCCVRVSFHVWVRMVFLLIISPSNIHFHRTVIDPADNMFATANNGQNVVGLPMLCSLHMGSYRSDRIYEQLLGKDSLTPEDFKTLQLDLYSKQAEGFMEVLRPAITKDHGEVGRILSEWNLEYDVASMGATLFEIFYEELLNDMFEPVLGGTRLTFQSSDMMIAFFHYFDKFLLER
jgi:penicillin amidase